MGPDLSLNNRASHDRVFLFDIPTIIAIMRIVQDEFVRAPRYIFDQDTIFGCMW